MRVNHKISTHLSTDDTIGLHSMDTESIIHLATALHENGFSIREAEAMAADMLDRDTMGEQRHLNNLSTLTGITDSTVRSHYQNGKARLENGTIQHYMLNESMPKQIIARFRIPSTKAQVDSVIGTVGRYYNYSPDNEPGDNPREESYAICLAEYESTGWKDVEYRGETVRRVTGRTTVLDELNRILKDYESNYNPHRLIGEMMYALDIPNGQLNPEYEYKIDMELVSPLCNANEPPEEYDTAPHAYGNVPTLLNNRF